MVCGMILQILSCAAASFRNGLSRIAFWQKRRRGRGLFWQIFVQILSNQSWDRFWHLERCMFALFSTVFNLQPAFIYYLLRSSNWVALFGNKTTHFSPKRQAGHFSLLYTTLRDRLLSKRCLYIILLNTTRHNISWFKNKLYDWRWI